MLPGKRRRYTLERLARGHVTSRLFRGAFASRIDPSILNAPLLFIHVPKNAGTSIKRALYPVDIHHRSVRCYEFLDPDFLQRAKIFALVRDPCDRFLSAYDFFRRRGGADASFAAHSRKQMRGLELIDNVLDYIESKNGDWLEIDDVFRPQYWYLVNANDRIAAEQLFLFSDDIADVTDYLREHGFPAPKHLNRTERSDTRLTAYQTRRVEAIYARDVTLFDWVKSRSATHTNAAEHRASIGAPS